MNPCLLIMCAGAEVHIKGGSLPDSGFGSHLEALV